MKKVRIFYPEKLAQNELVTLPPESSHHLLQVLRFKAGDSLFVFNGGGDEYQATLHAKENKLAIIKLTEKLSEVRESPLEIELAPGISKGERMDYVIQKSVELGVGHISPLFTSRCEVKLSGNRLQKKMDHWKKVIVSACEQSGRLNVPTLNEPLTEADFLRQEKEGLKLICAPGAGLVSTDAAPKRVTIMIGPEGGFTENEVSVAGESGYVAVGLGPRTLRTETAAVVAVALAQSHWGDMSK